MLMATAMLLLLYVFYCQSIMCSTRDLTLKLPKLFIITQHQVFFDCLWIKLSIFFSTFFSIDNDRSAVAVVGWAFCNNVLMFEALIRLAQVISAYKSEFDSGFLM